MALTSVYLILIGLFHCFAVRTFLHTAKKLNFDEAKEACKTLGMDVALALDDTEIDAMNAQLAYLGTDVEAWLGLVYTGREREFNWINGDSLSFNRWDVTTDDEPDQLEKQHCVVWRRRDNQWDSRECSKKYTTICSGRTDMSSATFTIFEKNKKLNSKPAATVTSESNIKCAIICKQLGYCGFFTMDITKKECSLYSSEIVPASEFTYRSGSQVWKMN